MQPELTRLTYRELAKLENPDNSELAYNTIRQRAVRGIYTTIDKSGSLPTIALSDPAIPESVRIKYMFNNSSVAQSIRLCKNHNLNELSNKNEQIALARAALINKYIEFVESFSGSKVQAKIEFCNAYNKGVDPELFNKVGKRDWKSLERWRKTYLDNNKDYRVLSPAYKTDKKSSVTPQQAEILIQFALNPRQFKYAEIVRFAIEKFEALQFAHIKHQSTYERWLKQFEKNNRDVWIFFREGKKKFNDKVLRYIERDYSAIEVGDIIVADGHVLNFTVINPFTGKPKRMMWTVYYDMKSNMPLGWEIAPTENVQAIATALYRAIIRLGKYPRVIYIDNGRAFGAKYFTGKEDEFNKVIGIIERLDAKVITAWAYHGQSKNIERFFGTFSELERMMPSYSGTSIELQPAYMNRGEKLHKKIQNKVTENTTIDIITAHKAIAWWLDRYAMREQQSGHLEGKRPIDIFNTGKGEGIDKQELLFLMMKIDQAKLDRNGVSLLGKHFWHDSLYARNDYITVRYDILTDPEHVYCYEQSGEFICTATKDINVHPAAGPLGSEEDVKLLTERIQHKRLLEKSTTGEARAFFNSEILPAAQKQLQSADINPDTPDKKISARKKQNNIFKKIDIQTPVKKDSNSFLNNINVEIDEYREEETNFFRKVNHQ